MARWTGEGAFVFTGSVGVIQVKTPMASCVMGKLQLTKAGMAMCDGVNISLAPLQIFDK